MWLCTQHLVAPAPPHAHTPHTQVAAQLGLTDVSAEFAALATRLHASLDALFWDAQAGAYADFYVVDAEEDAPSAKTTTADSSASASPASASGEQPTSSNAAASEPGTATATAASTTDSGATASAPVSAASASSPLPVKRFVRHAGYVALFPLLLRLVHASDSTRLHALLGTCVLRDDVLASRVQLRNRLNHQLFHHTHKHNKPFRVSVSRKHD